jgi:hypothetical protein
MKDGREITVNTQTVKGVLLRYIYFFNTIYIHGCTAYLHLYRTMTFIFHRPDDGGSKYL